MRAHRAEDHCGEVPKPPTVRIQDTAGIDDKQTPRDQDLLGAQDFVTVWETAVLDRWRGGTIQVTGTVTDSTGAGTTYQYALIEVKIIGWIGSAANILHRGVIGGSSGPIAQPIDQVQTYNRISVEARKIIDGIAGAALPATPPLTMSAGVIARFVRS